MFVPYFALFSFFCQTHVCENYVKGTQNSQKNTEAFAQVPVRQNSQEQVPFCES